MSDSLRPDDEAVSSVLDGEAAPEEAELVAGSPELSARLDEFRSVAGLVGAPVTVPGEELDRIRSAAVARAAADNERTAADDEQAAATHDDSERGEAVDLAAAAERRRGRLRVAARVVSAAAALLVAAGLGYGLAELGDSDDGFEDIAMEAALDAPDETAGDVNDSASFDDEESTDVADMTTDLAGTDDAAQDDAASGDGDSGLPATSSESQDQPAAGDSGMQAAETAAQALGPGFDPLPDRLDPVSNLEALTTVLQDRLAEYAADPDGSAVQSGCEALLVDTALASGAIEADSAHVLVDGARYAVVVARHDDPGKIEVLVAPEPGCEPVSPLQPALP